MSAPIQLITGLPGNGKTLFAIKMVKEWAEREKRPVFYHGIEILDETVLPWTKIDPQRWFDAPPGAIIIIDECQIIFRPRSLGKEPPDYVARLETIRHQGLNLVLITQHPLLADASIRRLTGKHLHCIRKWGTESSTVHEWPSVRDNCDKSAGRKDSTKQSWKFDKSIYKLYKSAEVHTIKRSIPKRVWFLLSLPLVLAVLGYGVYWFTVGKKLQDHPQLVASAGQIQPGQIGQATGQTRQAEKWEDPLADAKRYVFDQTPRVVGLPHTAPRYDQITQPTSAPVPSACIVMRNVCKCYSQQATIMDTPDEICREIVDRGFYVDFRQEQINQGQQYLVRGDALRVPVDPQQPDQIRAGSAVLAADLTTAGRTPDGVRARNQDSQHLAY